MEICCKLYGETTVEEERLERAVFAQRWPMLDGYACHEGECGIQLLYIRYAIKPRSSRTKIPRQLIMITELFLSNVSFQTSPVLLDRLRVITCTMRNLLYDL